jgi:hypothetical protein
MSRRITHRSEMKDRELVAQAAKSAGIAFRDLGNNLIQFTSGNMANSTLDLGTGVVTGDSDHGHTSAKLGMLRQHYAEAQVRREFQKTGTNVKERQTNDEGSIILMWHRA